MAKDRHANSKFKDEYSLKLREHMAQGFSFESFAGLVGVCRDTLYYWAENYKTFAQAKAEAFELSRLFWERLGITHVIGDKERSISAPIYIFNMKNRFPREWRDRVELPQSQRSELGDQDRRVIDEYLERINKASGKKP